ncbi:heterokaryon incompatibility protein [Stagonosporopsis vannaccii]|nr:heterokaryon incompatibility protein [Stagonosporopsis vannaccii]
MLSRLLKRQKAHCRYDKLEKGQIRLLKLQPGCGSNRLVCTLQTVDLLAYDDISATSSITDFERYEALSYVWGDAHLTTEIDCDGQKMHVTKNLADALQAFRHESLVRILWADALCINQRDTREREQQVKLMGLIYWKAFCVRVWLGEDDVDEDVHRARHAIRVIKELAHIHLTAIGSTAEEYQVYRDRVFEEPDHIDESDWTSLDFLLNRPWFQRVWVVQELGLARNAVFHCGERYFTRNELQDFMAVLNKSRLYLTAQHNVNIQMLRLGNDYWRSCWGNTRLELGSDPKEAETFLDILGRARGLSCTDPRDSVYAFLGHPSAFKRQMLDIEPYHWYPRNYYCGRKTIVAPNYRKSNTYLKLYQELAIAAITDVNLGLNLLSHVSHTEDTISSDYPSWVPRWDATGLTGFIGCDVYFAASGNFSSATFELSHYSRNGLPDQVSFRGWRLDTIRCVRGIPVTEHLAECLDVMALLLSDAPKMRRPNAIPIPKLLTYPYEEPFVMAFASTMTAGLTSSWEKPCEPSDEHPHQHVRNFHAYYRHEHSLDVSSLSDAELDCVRHFALDVRSAASRRVLFITHDGRLGLGPPVMQGSDQIWIPVGAKMPIILRPYEDGRFKVVGQTYVDGVMRGEAVADKDLSTAEKVVCF